MGKGPAKGPQEGEPRLRTKEVVLWIYRTRPDRFTASEIMGEFEIPRGEAYRRMQYMVIYGLAKRLGAVEAHRSGRREVAYTLTAWGRKYGQDQSKRKKG
jgi:hypothetical protein